MRRGGRRGPETGSRDDATHRWSFQKEEASSATCLEEDYKENDDQPPPKTGEGGGKEPEPEEALLVLEKAPRFERGRVLV